MKRVKAKLYAKLKSQTGESLGEVLVALLIAALALTMLASVIATTSKIITQSKETLEHYYDANDVLAEQVVVTTGSAKTPEKTVTVMIKATEGSDTEVNLVEGATSTKAYLFENTTIAGTKVLAYHLKKGTGGGGS